MGAGIIPSVELTFWAHLEIRLSEPLNVNPWGCLELPVTLSFR